MEDITCGTISDWQAKNAAKQAGTRLTPAKQRNTARVEASDKLSESLKTLSKISEAIDKHGFDPCDVYNLDEVTIVQREMAALPDVLVSPHRRLGEALTT